MTLAEELARIRKRLEALPAEERRLVEGYRKGLYPDNMMQDEMDRVRQEQGALEARRRELQGQLGRPDRAQSYKAQVGELARRLSQGREHMGFPQRQELLRLLVEEIPASPRVRVRARAHCR